MNEKESLNLLDFLATGINKEDPAIKAIISDENGEGAIANEIEELTRFIKYYSRTDDVSHHKGKPLEMIIKLFTKLRRRISETDEILLRRFLALTARKRDTIWGNALNLKHVFEVYFRDIACYVAENTNQDSILSNGGFEIEDDDTWTLDGGAAYTPDARFSGKIGLFFDGGKDQSCTQELDHFLTAGNYTLHFFLYGKCGVIIENEDGKYWNANDQKFSGDTVLEWVTDEVVNYFESPDGWNNVYCFVVLPEDFHRLKIKFVSIDGETACIDYVRFFSKPLNSSYTLVFQYEGYSVSTKSLHTAADGADPVTGINYEGESYFDHAFIVGPVGVTQSRAFKNVLEIVRPRGIQAFAEFVEKNTVEQEE
jgi:hypothetical protein